MPRLIVTANAALGLERCRLFLHSKDVSASKKAAHVIHNYFIQLEANPDLGRQVESYPQLRELIITFGNTGYVALYRHDTENNCVVILAFKHQKEAGYD